MVKRSSNMNGRTGLNTSLPVFEEFLAQHHSVLENHFQLCERLRLEQHADSAEHQVAQICMNDAQKMIENFKRLQSSYNVDQREVSHAGNDATQVKRRKRSHENNHNERVQPTVRSRMAQPSGQVTSNVSSHSVQNDNEFFTVDTNPTPLEELMSETTIRQDTVKGKKRKQAESGRSSSGTTGGAVNQDDGAFTKKRVKSQATDGARMAESTNAIDTEHEESFLAKVASKHDRKEARRLARADRKRKRASHESLADHASGNIHPSKKKSRLRTKRTDIT